MSLIRKVVSKLIFLVFGYVGPKKVRFLSFEGEPLERKAWKSPQNPKIATKRATRGPTRFWGRWYFWHSKDPRTLKPSRIYAPFCWIDIKNIDHEINFSFYFAISWRWWLCGEQICVIFPFLKPCNIYLIIKLTNFISRSAFSLKQISYSIQF